MKTVNAGPTYLNVSDPTNPQPLVECPNCGHGLTGPDGIHVEFTTGSVGPWEVSGVLSAAGTVECRDARVQTDEYLAASCFACDEVLTDLPGVREVKN